MLKRKTYNDLLYWKQNHNKTCLMIKGARQVGKTFLIREFGKNEYEYFIELNFIKNPEYKAIFSEGLDANTIYKNITSVIYDIPLIPKKTLIFLDEIQACGNARTAIKFLAEDNRFDVITSGSLLGLTYGEDDDSNVEEPVSNPTGYEDFITMYSLDFEEFLWACGVNDNAINVLKEYFDSGNKIPEIINNKYESLFREYIVVGGMPEVVADFVINKDFGRVHKIQSKIINDYEFDIAKHAKGAEKIKVKKCYDSIPKQLAKEFKKFQFSFVEKGQTSKKYGDSINWLVDSALVHICYNVSEPYIPLLGNAKDDFFKLYVNDTGLLCCMYGFDIKKTILQNTIIGNVKGGIYENVIGELLVKKGYKLYYYKPDTQHEIEFIIERNSEVIPIEVKSGNTITPSLNQYISNFNPSIAIKLINGNQGIIDNKKTIPHYMILFI